MNDTVKIASVFEKGRAVRPRGETKYYENSCNWLFIVLDGYVSYADNEREVDLCKDFLYVLPAGKTFTLVNPPQGGPDHVYVLLSCNPPIREFISMDLTENEFLRDTAKLIEKYVKKSDSAALISLLEAALGYVMTNVSESDLLAKRVKRYIDENAPAFDIKRVCEKFSYSRRYLDMKFKESYGVTVDKYGAEKKFAFILNEVIKKVPLEAICRETDYSSAANLSRDFKKRFGMPPLAYRQFLEKR